MTFVNYKKNELPRVDINNLKASLPDLKNSNKTQAILVWLIDWIDNSIKSKKIISDTLLPTKAEFAYALGVSLGTIQNVLKQLEDKGYIYSKQCIGSIIRCSKNSDSVIRKRTSKKDITENKIKNYIISASFKLGDKLPASRTLAKETGMTLNTVRNALNKLISDKILEYNSKKDLIIKSLDFTMNNTDEETLVSKVKNDLKKYICDNFKVGDKLPAHNQLAER